MGGVRRRIGLLGGTFDPPHVGHLWLAETAREQLRLDEVVFLPVGAPPHKEGLPVTAVSHRLTMLQLALAGTPFTISTLDLERQPPHTTVTLLPLLQTLYADATLWWLIGADSLRDLPTWVEPHQVITFCRLGVLPRPGVAIDWGELETAVPGVQAVVDWLAGPTLAVSASEIRRWAMAGHPLRYLVDTAVLQYVQHHRLYTK